MPKSAASGQVDKYDLPKLYDALEKAIWQAHRRQLGMTFTKIAELAIVDVARVSTIAQGGYRSRPRTMDELLRLCETLGVDSRRFLR